MSEGVPDAGPSAPLHRTTLVLHMNITIRLTCKIMAKPMATWLMSWSRSSTSIGQLFQYKLLTVSKFLAACQLASGADERYCLLY